MNLTPTGLYSRAATLTSAAGTSTPGSAASPTVRSFMDALTEASKGAVATMREGEGAAMQGIAGTLDTHQVVAAMTQAELTLQATVAVRDKMVQAYQELMRMPV